MSGNDSLVLAFLVAISAPFFATAGIGWWERGTKNPRAGGFAFIGAALVFIGILWQKIEPLIAPALAASISKLAADARTWLALLAALWLYGAVTSIITLRQRDRLKEVVERDLTPFRIALERFLLPRKLVQQQTQKIADYLRTQRPHRIRIVFAQDDYEAEEFSSDIQYAFSRGGWATERQPRIGLRQGLHIPNVVSTQNPGSPSVPAPEAIIQQAFLLVSIKPDGSPRIDSKDTQADLCEIHVGTRRRDLRAPFQGWTSGEG